MGDDSKELTVTEAKETEAEVTNAKDDSKEPTVTDAKVSEPKDSSKGRDSTVTDANVTKEKDSINEIDPAVNKAQDHNVDEENDYDSENSSDPLEFNLPNQKLNTTSLFGYDNEMGVFDD